MSGRSEPQVDEAFPDIASSPAAVQAVVDHVVRQRWFGGRDRGVDRHELIDLIVLGEDAALAVVRIDFLDGGSDRYAVPLAVLSRSAADGAVSDPAPGAVVDAPEGPTGRLLVDALASPRGATSLFGHLASGDVVDGATGTIRVELGDEVRRVMEGGDLRILGAEQSNSSIVVAESAIVKVLRRLHAGENPDLELGRHLTQQGFEHHTQVLGSLTWSDGVDTATLGIVSRFVPNEGDAWEHLVPLVQHFLATRERGQDAPAAVDPIDVAVLGAEDRSAAPAAGVDGVEDITAWLSLLGRRTAELHLALADSADPDMVPVSVDTGLQRALHESVTGEVDAARRELDRRRDALLDTDRVLVDRVVADGDRARLLLDPLLERSLGGLRIRVHGDYHLGQVLWTGDDFVIVDFEGEPARPLEERRIRRSPLADVAGMMRSLDYAAHVAREQAGEERDAGRTPPDEGTSPEGWASWWSCAAQAVFLRAYLEEAGGSELLPPDPSATAVLLRVHLLEKTAYEVLYELRYRPDRLSVPLAAFAAQLTAA